MADKRTYRDSCGIARALDLVGDRWALLVVRELIHGPKRFGDLLEALPCVSSDILTQRLRDLEAGGVLVRRKLPPPAGSRVYQLTERGLELEPVLIALGRWGGREPLTSAHGPLTPDAFTTALATLFDPEAAKGLSGAWQLNFDDNPFFVEVDDGQLKIARGEGTEPDAEISTSTGTLALVLWHGASLAEAERDGAATVKGPRREVRRLVKLFPPPQPVGPKDA